MNQFFNIVYFYIFISKYSTIVLQSHMYITHKVYMFILVSILQYAEKQPRCSSEPVALFSPYTDLALPRSWHVSFLFTRDLLRIISGSLCISLGSDH